MAKPDNTSLKRVAILGSTGSIGTQTVDVIRMHPDVMRASLLVARRNVDLLAQQAMELRPERVVIGDESLRGKLADMLRGTGVEVSGGPKAIEEAVCAESVDIVVAAMVGFSGFGPTMAAIGAGKDIALANKETLVVAGQIVMAAARDKGVAILPVDSEHSAIFQSLQGEKHLRPRQIILTASGGPFRGMTRDQLASVTPQMALRHPNWDMGAKVTIDSASMMNKGLEAIEARWLFDVPASQIEILVHPQSIVHSAVEFEDGSIKAQLGVPDMRIPIQYALTYPDRMPSPANRLDLTSCGPLTFDKPDPNTFRNLALALAALDKGGNSPCAMNGANEVAVARFLKGDIGFLDMSDVVEQTMEKVAFAPRPSMVDLYATDAEARRIATALSDAMTKN
ncbi:MAG: 1-deoxy-D-xylulose-5-phosphate reductoisomerase [Bacteroidales bacterium]|nr:1-deoxy-D-xylulose-5-phosphate reductoisomerase [Bacteroidales bacterium]